MLIVIQREGEQHEVDLQVEDPAACVSDLVTALYRGRSAPRSGIAVDGRYFGPDAGLDEIRLYDGALVRLASSAAGTPAPLIPEGPVLALVGGPAAGPLIPLTSGAVVIGRDDGCDIVVSDQAMSARHARLSFDNGGDLIVTDLGSRNGTWVGEAPAREPTVVSPGALVRFGATQARYHSRLPFDRPVAVDPWTRPSAGPVPFNRPPRTGFPHPPAPISAPAPSSSRSRAGPLNVVAIVAPLVMAGVMIALTGEPRFALFMLMSPVVALGTWYGSKRRASKEHQVTGRELRAALVEFEAALMAAADVETARRELVLPDIAETLRRAELPSTQLWQRRPHHADFLRLRAGIGDLAWDPPLAEDRAGVAEEAGEVVRRRARLVQAPVEIDLSGGGVVGVIGDRAAALSLARSLVCQAAIHHGPADLGVVVLAAEEHRRHWEWSKWLPHVRNPSGSTRLLAGDRETADALLAALSAADDDDRSGRFRSSTEGPRGRTRLYVVDDVSLIQGRRAPARLLLGGAGGPAAGIVIAETEDQLPAVCTTVVDARNGRGHVDLRRPQELVRIDGFLICGVTEPAARRSARALARYEDPEMEIVGAGLPQVVRLLPLLGMDDIDGRAVLRAWAARGADPTPTTPIGMGEDGVVWLDLSRDGPHGLVGGTTGSGKSELLRSLVAGMATQADPDHLSFVLVDFKGGSAFDQCAELPHTVGMVTDLDEHLGERALKSLEAELRYRERLLRDAGAPDLPDYLKAGSRRGPLPRLVVVIDEFATLATELPDFMTAMVGIAQRGRSLGVHLILATQRPSGVVNANIKANTNLRIALRVQDTGDSTDIIDRADAAAISRGNPGRAYVRLGPGDVTIVQTALATAAGGDGRSAGVQLRPFSFRNASRMPRATGNGRGPTDLARLVAAVQEAFARSGRPPPREPWLPMLPERVDLGALLVAAGEPEAGVTGVPFALGDDPANQRQAPVGWDPADGHLALFGMVGSGTTTAALAVAVALTERHPPDECHIYALDFGTGGLSPLAKLPHVGAVIGANEREAQYRLVRLLRSELDRRRSLPAAELSSEPLVVVLIDGLTSFLAEQEDSEQVVESFRRVFSEGMAVGITFVVTADRPGALPSRLLSVVSQRILFRLADPSEFSAIGVRLKELPRFVPGRALHGVSRQVIQVGHPEGLLAAVPGGRPPAHSRSRLERPPVAIGTIPSRLPFADLPAGSALEPAVELTVGIADDNLGPAVLALGPGDHALVTGPRRSGKSSTLALVAELVRAADPATVLVGVCDERSPLNAVEGLDAVGSLEELIHIVRAAPSDQRRWFLLVDDAPLVDDVGGVLAAALKCRRPDLHVVAAGRPDDLRGGYGHWTRAVRQSRSGILLQPDLANDGELLGVRLPRRLAVPLVPGRGFVVTAGDPILAQVALPPEGEPRVGAG